MPEFYLVPKKLARALPAISASAVWLEGQLIGLLLRMIGAFSIDRASAFGARVVGFIGPSMAQASKVRENLAIAFPNWDEATLERTTKNIFRQLGMAIAELVKMDEIWSDREKRLEFAIDPLSIAHFKSGRGSVMVTAHVGAWQVTNLLARQQNMKITTVFAEESNPSVRKAMRRLREAFGVHWLPTNAGVRPLLRELEAGNSIGLATDTRLDTGELVPFFGVNALTNTSAARLALSSGAALIPVRGERLRPGYYRISVYAPVASPNPAAAIGDQAREMTRLINEHFETWIRATPDQWMCFKRRWPKDRATPTQARSS
ncbi:MAG: hypothetical protein PVF93_07720 [Chromatiaceae bacterium]